MAPRGSRPTEARLAFDALSIEGGLLGAEWLGRVAQRRAGLQEPADYRIPKGLDVRDEIARSWRIAQACFRELEAGRAAGGDARTLAERFVEPLLRDALGFASVAGAEPRTIDDRVYPVRFFALGDRVPVVVARAGAGLDTLLPELGDDQRRRSAFGLLQETLNASGETLWGLATDGLSLRIARDNASLTRPAWVEADLGRIFSEDLYPDFAALWLLAHESRFGRAGDPDGTCPLEAWRKAGREEGTRARERLSAGFQDALEILGQGFLSLPANTTLRAALHAGGLTRDGYFGQLLRLVYRLVFLLTVEERDLLHPKNASQSARRLYADGYGLRRLRDRAVRRSAHDRQGDQWEAVRIVFRSLAGGEPRLGLPALAGLFAAEECPDLDAARLENRALLGALFHLAWLREPSGLVRVNWRDMGADELGYVYEGLLELVPQITGDGRSFSFAGVGESRGHARKTTGSYYTPDELVQVLLDSALDPVVERTVDAHPERPVDALLDLAIVDPACGSGHFLLAAARRLADRVARIRAGGTPTPDDYQRALRDVVRRCIYGVDRNPLAVELCKVSLWMESIDPGLPLTFLESHVRCGNSLIGATRALMGDQVADAAWTVLEGDVRQVNRSLKKRNREEITGQRRLLFEPRSETVTLRDAIRAVEQAPDADAAAALAAKQRQWNALLASEPYEHEKLVADAWCAAFLWPKDEPGPVVEEAPTTAAWLALRDGEGPPSPELVETTRRIVEDYGVFHWDLAFPDVFARGGFDIVLGNPPWERVKLQEQEFFARREPAIAAARNAAERKKLIAALPATNPDLWKAWTGATRIAQGQSHFVRKSGRYLLCGKGDVNAYALFAEHNWRVLAPRGCAGFIVPSGIVTDDTTKQYFQALLDGNALGSVHHFENESLVFKGLHHAYRFVLFTIRESRQADLVFYARRAVDLDDGWRHFALTPADFATLNPNTRTCPTFRSRRDADINLTMYRRAGVLWRENDPDGNPWGLRFLRMFDMANDSGLFRTRAELAAAGWGLDGDRFERDGEAMLPLYEAKMVHQFDHRFGSYEGQSGAQANQGKLPELDHVAHADPGRVTLPRYWVPQGEVAARLDDTWDRRWMLGWRDIARASDIRTVISCIIPRAAVNDTFLLMMSSLDPQLVASIYANLSSFPFDYCARQKVGGVHLKYFTMRQLPGPRPDGYAIPAPWAPSIRIRDWLLPRVLELTYTAWNLKAFAEDCGDDRAPFVWDSERRFRLRCEIDAAFFHLYGISRDDTVYILGTFFGLEQSEKRDHGEYRTRRGVLETYDALAAAVAKGIPLRLAARTTEEGDMSRFRLREIRARNYRCFDELTLPIEEDATVLFAENGGGKTALLTALAMGLGVFQRGSPKTSRFSAARDIRLRTLDERGRREPVGRCELSWTADVGETESVTWSTAAELGSGRTTSHRRILEALDRVRAPGDRWPLFAWYGVDRLGRQRDRSRRVERMGDRWEAYDASLDPDLDEAPLLQWLQDEMLGDVSRRDRSKPERFFHKAVLETAVRATPGAEDAWYDATAQSPVVRFLDGHAAPWSELSDGYQGFIGLVADIARRAVMLNEFDGADAPARVEGVVLIDELDLHLHPRWQRVALPRLRDAFPRLQFVVTTHSPQVLSSAENRQVRRLVDGRIQERDVFVSGRDTNAILRDLMRTDDRDDEGVVALRLLHDAIDRGDREQADRLYGELVGRWGDADPALIRAKGLMEE